MNDEVRRAIGGRLREFRLSMGVTQAEMASELGVKRQSISAWERGEAIPRGEEWIKLGGMGLSLDYVVLNIRSVPVSAFARAALSLRVLDSAPAPLV